MNPYSEGSTCSSASEEGSDHDSEEPIPDYNFVGKPSEEFFCPVTLEVLQEPYLTVCCGNHLSQEAAKQLHQGQKPCPLCKQQLHAVPDKFFKRKVKELKVRCQKSNAGCGWVGNLGSLDQHLRECGYVRVVCPNMCGGRVLRRHSQNHQANNCPKRQFVCNHCAYKATYQEITKTHWPKCKKYPLECPNRCRKRSIERQHLPNHLRVCPLEVIECEFDYAGCTEKVQRQKMYMHEQSYVQVHLKMVAAHAKLQEQSMSIQQKKNEQQKKEIDMLTAQVYLLTSALQHCLSFKASSVFLPPPVFTMMFFEQYKKDESRWFSPPFYSHIGGYKMCIGVDANGSNTGEGTHISVYLHMMAGEYDDNLKWPFRGEVTVQLLNQRNNGNHYESSLIEADDHILDEFDTTYVARVQGVQERGLGWGYPKFFPHEELTYNDDKDCQYLMNDCLKFQVNKVVVLDNQT